MTSFYDFNTQGFIKYDVEPIQIQVYHQVEMQEQPEPVIEEKKIRKKRNSGEPRKPRVSNPDEWKINKAKKNRLAGQEYIGRGGIVVPARTMGPPCECPRKCYTEKRQPLFERLFTEFYAMKSKDIQDMYLWGLIHSVKVAQRRPKTGEGKPKSSSFKYHVKAPNEFFQVCKKAFCSIHAIDTSRLSRIQKAVCTWTVPEDRRGKYESKHRTVPEETLTMIDNHVKSIMNGHKTMPANVTLTSLYKSYVTIAEMQEQEDLKNGVKIKRKVSQDYLRTHLKKRFNISFATLMAKNGKHKA